MAVKEKIRIRLKSYDASLIDAAAAKLVETAKPATTTVEALMSLQLPAGVDIEIKL